MGMFVVAPATSFYEHPHLVHPHHHQQHQQQHPHQQHGSNYMTHEGNNPATALGVGVGVIPLLTAVDDQDIIGRSRAAAAAAGAMHLWQNQQQQLGGGGFSTPPNKKSINFDPTGSNLIPSSSGMSGGGTATCQDCGNQAKKDCSHRRCRTCCRSRGFDCTTHVKSTWVPAARRRERQMVPSGTGGVVGGGGGGGASSGSTSGAKKPRLISSQTTSHTSTSNTPPRSFETSSSHQDASFKETLPGQVRAPAVFKCVKVTAVDDGEDEFAYQAVVKIGGHVFKGFLYDQGVEQRDGFPNMSELHLGGGASTSGGGGGGGGGRNEPPSPVIDPSDVYGASRGGGLLAGSSYGNTIN